MSRNFSLGEFTFSATAQVHGIDNALPYELQTTALATLDMMQRIRDHLTNTAGYDVPITISSGYRCDKLNRLVGGAVTSDHRNACAVDFKAPAFGSPLEVATELAKVIEELRIGQLINEHPERKNQGWVHVSTRRPTKAINRVITITDKGTTAGVHKA